MTHPQHLLDMARAACEPIHTPSGVAMPSEVMNDLRALFGPCKLAYDWGFGYVLQVGEAQLLIGGRWNDLNHVKAWVADNQPKALVVYGFWQMPLFEAAA